MTHHVEVTSIESHATPAQPPNHTVYYIVLKLLFECLVLRLRVENAIVALDESLFWINPSLLA